MNTTTIIPNRYAGNCTGCEGRVVAGAGRLVGKVNGRWAVAHTDCPDTPAPRPAATARYVANVGPVDCEGTPLADIVLRAHTYSGIAFAAVLAQGLGPGCQTDLAHEEMEASPLLNDAPTFGDAYRAAIAYRQIVTGVSAADNPELVCEWAQEIGAPAILEALEGRR